MPHCENCDAHVTRDYVRVFGVEGTVHGCPACATYRDLQDGAGGEQPPGAEQTSTRPRYPAH